MNPYQTISLNPYQFQSESHYLLQKMVLFCAASPGTFASQRSRGCHRSGVRRYPGVVAFGAHPNMEEKHTRIQFLRKDERRRHTEIWGNKFVSGWKKSETDCQERVFKVFVLNIRWCQNFATKKRHSSSILRDFHGTVYVT